MATETFVINVQTRGTVRSEKNIKRIGAQANTTRKALALLRNGLVLVASLRVFANLTRSLIEFSDEMLVVKAVTAATEVQFKNLKATAQGLGATTRFTAAEAAQGMAFLARAGFETNEVIAAIPATLDLAAAAQLDLGRAADIASNLMTSFGLSVADLPNIMDTLVFTANNANTTVQQLADGLKLFSPIASQLGIDLQTASAAMAILGDSGIQASLAGTGLRRIITDLEAPTGALANVLNNLGISFDEVRPSTVGLEGALQRLKIANLGASAASVLFGKRGGFVAAALLRSLGAVGDFDEKLQEITGTAREAARIMEMGLGGAVRLLRSAFQNLIITFGEIGLEDNLNQFFRSLAAALREVARNAEQLVKAMKFLFALLASRVIFALVAALTLASGRILLFTGQTWLAARAAAGAAATTKVWALALLKIPFVAIITGLALVTAGLISFGAQIELGAGSVATLDDVWTAFGELLSDFGTTILSALGLEFSDMGEVIDAVATRVGQAIAGIGAVFAGLLAASGIIIKKLELLWKSFLLGLEFLMFSIQNTANDLANAVGLDDIFDVKDNADAMATLVVEVRALNAELELMGSATDAFLGGGRKFLARIEEIAEARRTAERDARILRSENQRRTAAGAGISTEGEEAFLGRQDIAELAKAASKSADAFGDAESALRSLEGSVFPTVAAFNALIEVEKILTEAQKEGVTLLVDEAELLKRVRREQLGAGPVLDTVAEKQRVLNQAWRDGVISLRELETLTRTNRLNFLESQTDAVSGLERAFIKLETQATDSAAFTEMVFTDAFKSIEDAVIGFVDTGKFEIDDFFRNFADQLLRLATQQAIAGIGGIFTSLLPTGGAAAGGTLGNQTEGAGPGGFVASLLGSALAGSFHNGGQFTVGANTAVQSLPGLDNRLIAFKANDGEEVTVTPKGQGAGPGGNVTLIQNITTRDADSFKRSESQLASRAAATLGRARARR